MAVNGCNKGARTYCGTERKDKGCRIKGREIQKEGNGIDVKANRK